MPSPESISTGVAHRIGHYADAVLVPAGHEQIFVSGTPGLVWPELRVEVEVTAVRRPAA